MGMSASGGQFIDDNLTDRARLGCDSLVRYAITMTALRKHGEITVEIAPGRAALGEGKPSVSATYRNIGALHWQGQQPAHSARAL